MPVSGSNKRLRIACRSNAKRTKNLTLDELIELMGGALVPSSREVSREYVAAQSLLHAAARDSALRPHAQQLYANMGEATLALFQRTPGLCNRIDPLSTSIFALWTDAMLCNAGLESPSEIASSVLAQQRAMISLLASQA